jgi:uncharacterized protein (DUF302 family)
MAKRSLRYLAFIALAASVAGLLFIVFRKPESIAASRYVEPDRLFQALVANVRSHAEFEVIVDIDHSRLGALSGSPMPPSHVLIWSDPRLEAKILSIHPLAAVDLPLRILAYEDQATGRAAVIYNSYEFLAQRHFLPEDASLREGYESAVSKATEGIPDAAIKVFPSYDMPDAGLVTLKSPHDFEAHSERHPGSVGHGGFWRGRFCGSLKSPRNRASAAAIDAVWRPWTGGQSHGIRSYIGP